MEQPLPENAGTQVTLIFDDPRFKMTVAGRMLVRIVTYVFYIFLIAATVTLFISGIAHFAILAVLLTLFLVDRWIHRKGGDVSVSALPHEGQINVARAFGSDAFLTMERAFDRSILTKRNFCLETIDRIMEFPNIAEGLRRLDVPPDEFRGKLEDFLAKSGPSAAMPDAKKQSDSEFRAANFALMETLAIGAFKEALSTGHEFVEASDLFAALGGMKDGFADRSSTFFPSTRTI